MKRAEHSEAQLAAVVVEFLQAQGDDVYQEVELRRQGIRADIVARRGAELSIVETKTSASLALLYQAMERRRFAHRVYVAVPAYRAGGDFALLCSELGVGLYGVHIGADDRWDRSSVREDVVSRRWNTRPVVLTAKLRPEHKTAAAAGSQSGGHWTRWRETCAHLERIVAKEPGIALKPALQQITHHYSSLRVAVSTMATHVRAGRVPGVAIRDGALWPTEAQP